MFENDHTLLCRIATRKFMRKEMRDLPHEQRRKWRAAMRDEDQFASICEGVAAYALSANYTASDGTLLQRLQEFIEWLLSDEIREALKEFIEMIIGLFAD